MSRLCNAAGDGNLAGVKYFLERENGDIESRDEHGSTPLLLASKIGQLPTIKYLVGRGANLMARNSNGHTALSLAAMGGYIGAVKYLIHKGLNKDEEDIGGYNATQRAAIRGHVAVAKYLINMGGSLESETKLVQSKIYLAQSPGNAGSTFVDNTFDESLIISEILRTYK